MLLGAQLRLVTAIRAYSVCGAAFLGIGAKHLLTSQAPGPAVLDAVTTFALTLPVPLYMHTFTEVWRIEARLREHHPRSNPVALPCLGDAAAIVPPREDNPSPCTRSPASDWDHRCTAVMPHAPLCHRAG